MSLNVAPLALFPKFPESELWSGILAQCLKMSALPFPIQWIRAHTWSLYPQLERFIFWKKAKLFICVNSALGTNNLVERKQSYILSFGNEPSAAVCRTILCHWDLDSALFEKRKVALPNYTHLYMMPLKCNLLKKWGKIREVAGWMDR